MTRKRCTPVILYIICTMVFVLLLNTFQTSFAAAKQVQPSSWAQADVSDAISLGLVPKGLQSNYTELITREEFTELITQLAVTWYPGSGANGILKERGLAINKKSFTDTASNSVLFCSALGIVSGDGKGHFNPNGFLTRQEAAKILFQTADVLTQLIIESSLNSTDYRGYTAWEMPHTFADSSLLRVWSRSQTNWCYRTGVMQGVGGNKFSPNGTYTREQAVVTVYRLYLLYGKADQLKTSIKPDYYPIFSSPYSAAIYRWVDSSLHFHEPDEIGYIADPAAKYAFISDNTGAGVSYGHIINRKGDQQFTDLYGTNGYFSNAVINGDLITLYLALNLPHDKNAPLYFVIDTKTEKITENKEALPSKAPTLGAVVKTVSSGYYALYSNSGKRLSEIYPNGLFFSKENLYVAWISDNPRKYKILYCDGVSQARVLREEEFRFNNEIFSLGGGVYAVQNTDTKITVFDVFGDTISTITTSDPCILSRSANGLIATENQKNSQQSYYTQTGKVLPIIMN